MLVPNLFKVSFVCVRVSIWVSFWPPVDSVGYSTPVPAGADWSWLLCDPLELIITKLEWSAVPTLSKERLLTLVNYKSLGIWSKMTNEFPRLIGEHSITLLPGTALTTIYVLFSSTLLAATAFFYLWDYIFYFWLFSCEFNSRNYRRICFGLWREKLRISCSLWSMSRQSWNSFLPLFYMLCILYQKSYRIFDRLYILVTFDHKTLSKSLQVFLPCQLPNNLVHSIVWLFVTWIYMLSLEQAY